MSDVKNPKQFWQGQLFDLPRNGMPQGGITPGDEHQPLYRAIDLHKTAKGKTTSLRAATAGSLGSHWTHDLEEAKDWTTYMHNGHILEARHPGHSNVMSWDNPKDVETLDRTVVSKRGLNYRSEGTPEVAVRPGTQMQVTAVHINGKRFPVNKVHPA